MANIQNDQLNLLVEALRPEAERIRSQKARASSLAARISQMASFVAGLSAGDVLVSTRPDASSLPTITVADYNSWITDLTNLNATLGNITAAHIEKFTVRPPEFVQ